MVGLTGGIGAGKSTVAEMLTRRGAVVVDADLIARQVVEPGTPALAKLVERFGPDILAPDGALDRGRLAEIAFAHEESKRDLEEITHPAIGEEFLRQVGAAPADGIVVHDVPLLVESRRNLHYDAVIVVEAPRKVRLERLEARGIPHDDAERRMAPAGVRRGPPIDRDLGRPERREPRGARTAGRSDLAGTAPTGRGAAAARAATHRERLTNPDYSCLVSSVPSLSARFRARH